MAYQYPPASPAGQNPQWQQPWQPAAPAKSFVATWLLSLFLGSLGIDRFYLGKIGTGVLKLITGGGFGIWSLIDLIMTLCGAQRDKLGRPLEGYQRSRKMAWIVTIVLWLLGIIIGIIVGLTAGALGAAAFKAAENGSDSSTAPQSPGATAFTGQRTADPNVPAEYSDALSKAGYYAGDGHMSKKGLYRQLTSKNGEGLSKAAATYAVNHVDADWKNNALETAKAFSKNPSYSRSTVYDLLINEKVGGFTEAEAKYALDHLDD
ncbi:Ltp family lipoprotein [Brevibacterium sp. BRM-1]|uniref:Ltp family lipoprotein n=1 Tax=Brevibacterium sp. BRM-1 TaxID=2999062 RepID=UPI0022805F69|nr:Ltp family lipoprotein [Brevibacterium sp. BRM-1]WAL40630.1 Ltp family lipoprotein [Brevibacterium sp. BRM-1]